MIKVRRSTERGKMALDWLDARYSFSFGEYRDLKYMGFGSLRVLNEDRVAPGGGFPMHSHANFEIVSYVVSGQLKHTDSMGNEGVINAGEVQYMRAGRGVQHSEFNPSDNIETHLLQIWFQAKEKDLDPVYDLASRSLYQSNNSIVLVLSYDGRDDSIQINQDVDFYVSRLNGGGDIVFKPRSEGQQWIQVVKGLLTVNGTSLESGDGAAIEGESNLDLKCKSDTEFLLFDMKL